MLEVRNIVHDYQGQKILNGIDFRVGPEEVLCLLGPSGSGKSTMLRLIAGIEKPESGDILFDGKSILNEPIYKRNFGLVFQEFALFPHMNVYDNVAFGLRNRTTDEKLIREKTESILAQVGMSRFASRKVTDLSGGEQQRIALARSLVVHPSLLMLDEPLGSLDYSLRQTLIGELKELLGKNGIPAIYVTHDQNEALSLSDRIAVLHNGKIEQIGTPEEVFSAPKTEWIARFLGYTNFIPAEYSESGSLQIRNFDQAVTIPAGPEAGVKGETVLLKDCTILRPESPDMPVSFAGIVRSSTYHGKFYDITLQIDPDTLISVQDNENHSVGEKVRAGCPASGLLIYPDGPRGDRSGISLTETAERS